MQNKQVSRSSEQYIKFGNSISDIYLELTCSLISEVNKITTIERRLATIEKLLCALSEVLNLDAAAAYCDLSKSDMFKLTGTGPGTGEVPCHYLNQGEEPYFTKEELTKYLTRGGGISTESWDKMEADYLLRNNGTSHGEF
jgi:hypothetical protein